jgi:hypothetical protein
MLKLIFVNNHDHLLLKNLNKNMNKLRIKDKHELIIVAFEEILIFDIIDYLIVMDHQAMYHFDVEYIYWVNDKFV